MIRQRNIVTAAWLVALALFWQAIPAQAQTYNISATAGSNGSISPNGNVVVNEGESVTFTITPNECYYVQAVDVDSIDVGPVTSYTFNAVMANHTIFASFAAYDTSIYVKFITGVNGEEGNTITRSPDAPSYRMCTEVMLTATPKPGWQFLGWIGDRFSSDNPLVVRMDMTPDTTMRFFANFEEIPVPMLYGRVLGPSGTRVPREKEYDFIVGNNGATSTDVPVFISGIPLGSNIRLGFPVVAPSRQPDEPDWTQFPITLSSTTEQFMVFVIPAVRPGLHTYRTFITITLAAVPFTLHIAIGRSWKDTTSFRTCMSQVSLTSNPECMGSQLRDVYRDPSSTDPSLNAAALWAKVAWRCEGATDSTSAVSQARQVLEYMLRPAKGESVATECQADLALLWQDSLRIEILASDDPNDIIGPTGIGPSRLVSGQERMPYIIRCENRPSATAPAQTVKIINPVDSTLAPESMVLGPVVFGTREFVPPADVNAFSDSMDVSARLRVYVSAGLTNGDTLQWLLESKNPETGGFPDDSLGILYPNHNSPEGEGYVMYSIRPRVGLVTGDSIMCIASIVFDQNQPIATPLWFNVVDNTPPTSSVNSPAVSSSTTFPVQWSGSPDTRDYTVLVREDNGPYTAWLQNTSDTAADFTGTLEHLYYFKVLARDLVGNVETVNENYSTTSVSDLTDVHPSGQYRLALAGARPNPSPHGLHIAFSLADYTTAWLEVFNLAGQRVLRQNVGALGPGWHVVTVGPNARVPVGVYFIRLGQGSRSFTKKAIVLR